MSDSNNGSTERQTTPKGAEIPVPKRDEFFKNLEKVAPPSNEEAPRDSGAREEA